MGSSGYNFQSRSIRTQSYASKSADEIFEQNRKHTAHDSMLPNKANKAHLRESRDSETHPNSVPIIIALDVTGSMGDIPTHLIKEGLPKMVSRLMELGVADPQILIMAVGDSRCDGNNGVFQLGQFESGDSEMDMWLERIWISKGGGGNGGESYNWPYFYALHHVKTDAWEKRKQKGFIFTIGDDHCHQTLSSREIQEVMGEISTVRETVDTKSVVDALKSQWNIYHLELGGCTSSWSKLLGSENVLTTGRTNYDGMGEVIAQTVASYTIAKGTSVSPKEDTKEESTDEKTGDAKPPKVML